MIRKIRDEAKKAEVKKALRRIDRQRLNEAPHRKAKQDVSPRKGQDEVEQPREVMNGHHTGLGFAANLAAEHRYNALQDHEWVELLRKAGLVTAFRKSQLTKRAAEARRERNRHGLKPRALDRAWAALSRATPESNGTGIPPKKESSRVPLHDPALTLPTFGKHERELNAARRALLRAALRVGLHPTLPGQPDTYWAREACTVLEKAATRFVRAQKAWDRSDEQIPY